MAGHGRPTAELVLTEEERGTLSRWARRRKSAQALALRSRIVLGCDTRSRAATSLFDSPWAHPARDPVEGAATHCLQQILPSK
jgi:hypothetical protein